GRQHAPHDSTNAAEAMKLQRHTPRESNATCTVILHRAGELTPLTVRGQKLHMCSIQTQVIAPGYTRSALLPDEIADAASGSSAFSPLTAESGFPLATGLTG